MEKKKFNSAESRFACALGLTCGTERPCVVASLMLVFQHGEPRPALRGSVLQC